MAVSGLVEEDPARFGGFCASRRIFCGFGFGTLVGGGLARALGRFAIGSGRAGRARAASSGRGARIDSTHIGEACGERRDGPGHGAPRPGGLFSEWFEFFPGILGCSVFVHIHPPGRNGRNVLRVNPIWPIPFHCLRHTTVSTTSQNTQDLHIPPEFRKWATLCMPGCPPRHDPRVRCRKAFVTYLLTLEMGRSTTAACSRSQRFGLCDQWRLSVDLEIHPPFLR